jgi:signal transduction histidine kinase
MHILSEKYRFLGWLSAILVAGFLFTSIAGYIVSRDSIRSSIAEQALPLTADNIYSEIQKDLLQPIFISSMMARDTFVREWILSGERDTGRIVRYLNEIKLKYGTNSSFLVSERSRAHYVADGFLKTVKRSDPRDNWYFRVREMKAPYETNVDPDAANRDTLTVFINYRVLDYHGNYIGATGVGLTLGKLDDHIDRYQSEFRRHIYFVDAQGQIVLAGKAMSGIRGSIRNLPGISAIAERILKGGNTPVSLEYQERGSPVLVNSRYIPELGWHLVVEQSVAGELKGIRRILFFNLAISAAISLLALAVMRLIVNRYQARLERMAQSALSHAATEMAIAGEQQQFVAMVSHEFRTPLAIIDISLQGLKRLEGGLQPEVVSRHQKINRASHRLQELIGNYLTNGRLRQAHLAPDMAHVELFGLVARVARRTEWRDLTLDLDDLPATIRGETELLRIVFTNLISNAVKYSPTGGNIRIGGSVNDGFAEIRITDSGIGIAAEDLPHIFDKYYRAPGNKANGTGLGLYLVKQIVELHGGTVSAQSVPGQGATLIVRLPLAG